MHGGILSNEEEDYVKIFGVLDSLDAYYGPKLRRINKDCHKFFRSLMYNRLNGLHHALTTLPSFKDKKYEMIVAAGIKYNDLVDKIRNKTYLKTYAAYYNGFNSIFINDIVLPLMGDDKATENAFNTVKDYTGTKEDLIGDTMKNIMQISNDFNDNIDTNKEYIDSVRVRLQRLKKVQSTTNTPFYIPETNAQKNKELMEKYNLQIPNLLPQPPATQPQPQHKPQLQHSQASSQAQLQSKPKAQPLQPQSKPKVQAQHSQASFQAPPARQQHQQQTPTQPQQLLTLPARQQKQLNTEASKQQNQQAYIPLIVHNQQPSNTIHVLPIIQAQQPSHPQHQPQPSHQSQQPSHPQHQQQPQPSHQPQQPPQTPAAPSSQQPSQTSQTPASAALPPAPSQQQKQTYGFLIGVMNSLYRFYKRQLEIKGGVWYGKFFEVLVSPYLEAITTKAGVIEEIPVELSQITDDYDNYIKAYNSNDKYKNISAIFNSRIITSCLKAVRNKIGLMEDTGINDGSNSDLANILDNIEGTSDKFKEDLDHSSQNISINEYVKFIDTIIESIDKKDRKTLCNQYDNLLNTYTKGAHMFLGHLEALGNYYIECLKGIDNIPSLYNIAFDHILERIINKGKKYVEGTPDAREPMEEAIHKDKQFIENGIQQYEQHYKESSYNGLSTAFHQFFIEPNHNDISYFNMDVGYEDTFYTVLLNMSKELDQPLNTYALPYHNLLSYYTREAILNEETESNIVSQFTYVNRYGYILSLKLYCARTLSICLGTSYGKYFDISVSDYIDRVLNDKDYRHLINDVNRYYNVLNLAMLEKKDYKEDSNNNSSKYYILEETIGDPKVYDNPCINTMFFNNIVMPCLNNLNADLQDKYENIINNLTTALLSIAGIVTITTDNCPEIDLGISYIEIYDKGTGKKFEDAYNNQWEDSIIIQIVNTLPLILQPTGEDMWNNYVKIFNSLMLYTWTWYLRIKVSLNPNYASLTPFITITNGEEYMRLIRALCIEISGRSQKDVTTITNLINELKTFRRNDNNGIMGAQNMVTQESLQMECVKIVALMHYLNNIRQLQEQDKSETYKLILESMNEVKGYLSALNKEISNFDKVIQKLQELISISQPTQDQPQGQTNQDHSTQGQPQGQTNQDHSTQDQTNQNQSNQDQTNQNQPTQDHSTQGQPQDQTNQNQTNQNQSTQDHSTQGQPQGQSNQNQSNQGQTNQGQTNQGQTNQGQTNQGQSNQNQSQDQSNQGQTNQGQSNQNQSQDQSQDQSQGQSNQNQPQGQTNQNQSTQGQSTLSNEEQECKLDYKYAPNIPKYKFIACLKYILDTECVSRFLLDTSSTIVIHILDYFNDYPKYLSPEENAYIDCIYNDAKRDKNKAIALVFAYVCSCYDFIHKHHFRHIFSREDFQEEIDKYLIQVDYPYYFDDQEYQNRMEIVLTSVACLKLLKIPSIENIIHRYINNILLLRAIYYKLCENKCFIIINYVKHSSDIDAVIHKSITKGNVDDLISLGKDTLENYASYENNRREYEFIACIKYIIYYKKFQVIFPIGNERTDLRVTEAFKFIDLYYEHCDRNEKSCIDVIANDDEFCLNKFKSDFYIYNKFVYECDFKAGPNPHEIVREFLRNNPIEDHHEDICISSDKYKKIAVVVYLTYLSHIHNLKNIYFKDIYNYINNIISQMPAINEAVKDFIKCFEENIVYFLGMLIYYSDSDVINKIFEADVYDFEAMKVLINNLIMDPDNTSHPSQDAQSSQDHQQAQLNALKKHAQVVLQHADQSQNTQLPPSQLSQQLPPQLPPSQLSQQYTPQLPPSQLSQQLPPQLPPSQLSQQYTPQLPPSQQILQQYTPQLPQQQPQPQYIPSLQKTFGTIHKRDVKLNKYDIM